MLRLAVLAVASLALASCADFDFVEQDVLLKHDAESDDLEVLLVYAGVFRPDEKELDVSASRVTQDAEGYRHFIFLGWPWEFNLPEIQESLAEQIAENDDPLAQRALDWMTEIAVEESGLFRREGGELCLYQRARVPKVNEGLALLNEAFNRAIVAEAEDGSVREELELPDEATEKLWVAHARAGKPWLAFEEGALVGRVPVSPHGAARGLHVLLDVAGEDESGAFPRLFEPLTEFLVRDDLATFRFGPGDDGWIRFAFENAEKEYRKELTAELVSRGVKILEEPPTEELRKLVE